MLSAQERLTRTFTRSSHTYTRTERTEISKTHGGETKREVHVEESTQLGGDPFRDVFDSFLGRERLGSFGAVRQEGKDKPLLSSLAPQNTPSFCFIGYLHWFSHFQVTQGFRE